MVPSIRSRLLAETALIDKLCSLSPRIIWAVAGKADAIDRFNLTAEGHKCIEALS